MKVLIALLALALAACAADVDDDQRPKPSELGQVQLGLIANTPNHSYRLDGQAVISQAGEVVATVNLSGTWANVSSTLLAPGMYEVELTAPDTLIKDGNAAAPIPATLTSPNPQTITIVAGQNALVSFAFSVEGDPVVFVCTGNTCGTARFDLVVTEVPPD